MYQFNCPLTEGFWDNPEAVTAICQCQGFGDETDNKEGRNTKHCEVGFQLNGEDLAMQDQKKKKELQINLIFCL